MTRAHPASGADGRGRGAAPKTSTKLTVVLFDGTPLGSMSFAFGVFDVAAHHGALPGLDLRVVAGEPEVAIVGGGLSCPVPYDPAAIRDADLVIVAEPSSATENPPQPVLEALRAAHARGARIAGLCGGAFIMAAAGLLDGRPATTHWASAARLAEAYPKVRVNATALYIDDGDVLTAGGGAAGIDLCLHLLRAMTSAATANRLAKAMVLAPHRSGGQAQYIESPVPDLDPQDPVSETIAWMLTRLDVAMPVSLLAERAHMSRRHFDRRFRELTGSTPATWLVHQRVIRAQQLLESGDLPINEIARKCGFSSATVLRPHFRRLVGVAPSSYRETFTHRHEHKMA